MGRDDLHANAMDVLARERAYLLSGRYEELERIQAHKTAALARLRGMRDDRKLKAIRDQLVANNTLLEAAAHGFRTARDRVRDIRQSAGRFQTYQRNGARTDHNTTGGALEQRL